MSEYFSKLVIILYNISLEQLVQNLFQDNHKVCNIFYI